MEINECESIETDEPKDIYLGQVVHSKEEAYDLYQEHAFKVGFSVRKGKECYYDNEKKNTRLKDFYCSKQGFKNNEPDGEVAYRRGDSRTNCKAMVRFNVTKEGVWKVTKLILKHNHEFVPLHQRYLLRSMRNMSNLKEDRIKSMVNDAIKIGGFDKHGVMLKDMHNYVSTEKLKYIEAGDAQSLLNHLQNRQAQDSMFYYSVQLDQESRLTNVFWRDGKSVVDYNCFGDVVIFDTTYRANKYNLICAPFVGVNHHLQNIMFGCALLFDESEVSFAWLFKTFLESMGNQQPKTIFTTHDPAMAKAIGEVMPNACHRLCLWHIAKIAPSYLDSLISDQKFQSLFSKCMGGCDSEEEFQRTWDEMINVYKLQDHQWLSSMYEIRHKWSTAYSKNVFSAGIKSCQKIESTNNVLDEIAGKTTTLTQFLLAFEKMLKKWRRLEVEEEFKNSQRTGGSTSIEIGQSDNVSNHEVMLNHMPNKKYTVTFDSSNMKISCSCCKFGSMGILCSHALRIYNIKVLESQDSKEAQNIMWKLLDIGVERVRKGVGKANLTSDEDAMEKNFNENEESCFTPMPASLNELPQGDNYLAINVGFFKVAIPVKGINNVFIG
ncbi:hypothetical protein TSUD_135800 [Trifolium subterraneum]|uniref:SWIM-type domain-containing protein n=1 Tax=Trifolium subterraneum TaxID=3900 RepID=A0A2Z6P617_TRISU|nr:hypothetical protein TSUD_135800 [Trifolium subterraneum]